MARVQTVQFGLNGDKSMNIKIRIKALVGAIVVLGAMNSAWAQAKWWWEKYPTATDKTLNLQGATGSNVVAKQNPTGSNGSVAGNTATQPPTVIIQQTASSSTATPQLTCVQTATPAAGGASYGTTISVCPNIVGYIATPIVGGGYSGSYVAHYSNSTTVINNPIMACCYLPVAGVGTGAAAYSPWTANQAFNSNGYSGSQKQEFLTSGSFSWTVPAGVYRIWASVVGGGGGGGAGAWSAWAHYYAYPGAGGGRGGTGYRRPVDVIPGSTVSVKVGAGGAGGAGSVTYAGRSGSPGGNSYVTVNGYNVEAQGGFGASGGYEGNGYYSNPPPNPPTLVLVDGGRSTCNGGSCTGQAGHMGYLAVGGTGGTITGVNDGNSGRGAAMGQNYGDGNTYNPTGAGKTGASSYGGGGGAAGFIGMPYSTAVPSAQNGTTGSAANNYGATGGAGGYGYGAGGGGGNGGGMSSASFGNGGAGANGAVWIEW